MTAVDIDKQIEETQQTLQTEYKLMLACNRVIREQPDHKDIKVCKLSMKAHVARMNILYNKLDGLYKMKDKMEGAARIE